mmetsp:Transcript_93958/g.265904  ORF Transcript_93958/g.265904 Transcript_93958/m.265904 type:complete len:299 (+) Transcript_93958:34-930(+)
MQEQTRHRLPFAAQQTRCTSLRLKQTRGDHMPHTWIPPHKLARRWKNMARASSCVAAASTLYGSVTRAGARIQRLPARSGCRCALHCPNGDLILHTALMALAVAPSEKDFPRPALSQGGAGLCRKLHRSEAPCLREGRLDLQAGRLHGVLRPGHQCLGGHAGARSSLLLGTQALRDGHGLLDVGARHARHSSALARGLDPRRVALLLGPAELLLGAEAPGRKQCRRLPPGRWHRELAPQAEPLRQCQGPLDLLDGDAGRLGALAGQLDARGGATRDDLSELRLSAEAPGRCERGSGRH